MAATGMLRGLFSNVQVQIKVQLQWDQIFVWAVSIISLLGYVGVRYWYLLTGKTAALEQEEVSIIYSWMVLGAETLMGVLGFYMNQKFWKQIVKFSTVTQTTVDKMIQVLTHLVALPDSPLQSCCLQP
jgi:hypothetical protein